MLVDILQLHFLFITMENPENIILRYLHQFVLIRN